VTAHSFDRGAVAVYAHLVNFSIHEED
jgi:hypothetical protein